MPGCLRMQSTADACWQSALQAGQTCGMLLAAAAPIAFSAVPSCRTRSSLRCHLHASLMIGGCRSNMTSDQVGL